MASMEPPRTPTPGSRGGRRVEDDVGAQSPVPLGTITPPPTDRKIRPNSSSKMARPPSTPSKHSRNSSLHKSGSFSSGLGTATPTAEQIQDMSEGQLREMMLELVPAYGETRMELAHTKLQFQLLSMETKEQAQRAEVEHDMTRKELEILQASSPIIQHRAAIKPDPRSSLAQVQRQLNAALEGGHHLEVENDALEQRLKDAKRVIKYLDGQVFDLKENNKMLRTRIRDNRDHLEAMRASGMLRPTLASSPKATIPVSSSSINHYATPARPRKQADLLPSQSHHGNAQLITPSTARPQDDPFGALLFAGEVLKAQHERASVPSTPSPMRTMRQPMGHTRGAMSLSSLPVTPKVARFAPINVVTPGGHASRSHNDYSGRRGSASTISDSQDSRNEALMSRAAGLDEESVSDEDFPGSQASRAASNLLKKHPGDGLRQTKITGKVVKGHGKRVHSAAKDFGSPKKQKTSAKDGLGLGIDVWPNSAR